jgi:DNA-binding MarR family transcriptional regulator
MSEVSVENLAIADSLAEVSVTIARVANQESVTGDITVTRSQRAVLRYLSAKGPCAMFDLASGAGVTPPTMTSTIKILVRKKLVDRRHDDVDWRTVLISVSDLGRQTLANVASQQSRQIGMAIQQLPAEQRAMLMVALPSLRALAQSLDQPAAEE